MSGLQLPVLRNARVEGWPGAVHPPVVEYLEPGEVFSRRYATDAHVAAYSVPGTPHRLTLEGLGHLAAGDGWQMVLFIVDVDGPGHHREASWWAGELEKLAALEDEHPGGFVYATRGGYRIVYRLAEPVVVRTLDDKEAWRERYQRELVYLVRAFGIVGDAACSDITRLYRLPHATRTPGGAPEQLETRGDPSELGAWEHVPGTEELSADVATTRALAALSTSWSPLLRRLAPPVSSSSPEVPWREPESQAEERVFKRAAAYLDRMSPSIEGAGGDAALWAAAEAMTVGFALGPATASALLWRHFNPRCTPPWPRAVIERKCREAANHGKLPWGRLRDADGGAAGLRRAPQERPRAHTPPAEVPAGALSEDSPWWLAAGNDWKKSLSVDSRGNYRRSVTNLAKILLQAEGWDVLVYDDFSDRLLMMACPPSHVGLPEQTWPRTWRENDDLLVMAWFEEVWGLEVSRNRVSEAISLVYQARRTHPLRHYLDGLTWDGVPRLAHWLTTYLGVESTPYTQAVGASTLRAAVARILEPGSKVDTMLVLQGQQGAGKSKAIRALCGERWFTDDLAEFGTKDAAEQLLGAWFVEVAELGAMNKSEVERVKSFVSRQVDRFRPAYGRKVEERPRQCVFIGTTNADTYLRDETGNRRFWPVQVGAVGPLDVEALKRDRDQLWAEAVAQVAAGARWYLDAKLDPEAFKEATDKQAAAQHQDPWDLLVAQYVAGKEAVLVESILVDVLRLEAGRWGRSEQMRVSAILRRMGWSRHRLWTPGGGRPWGYLPPWTPPADPEPAPESATSAPDAPLAPPPARAARPEPPPSPPASTSATSPATAPPSPASPAVPPPRVAPPGPPPGAPAVSSAPLQPVEVPTASATPLVISAIANAEVPPPRRGRR
jgi:hypothetical protein